MNDLATLDANLPALFEADVDAARDYANADTAAGTRRAYASDWRSFEGYCAAHGLAALPAHALTVSGFLSGMAQGGAKASTIGRRLAAIRYAHLNAGHETPTNHEGVRKVMRGIRRTIGSAKVQKAPATANVMRDMLATCPDTLRGKRDRALLALGFAGAFRRSELVALTMADLMEVPDGFRVMVRHSKTDQEGAGQEVAIPRGARLRPVEAVQAWIKAAGITDGALFRSIGKSGRVSPDGLTCRTVANLVKHYSEAAGHNPEIFSGHSLRAGFLTSGAEAGANVFKLLEVSRHKSVDTLRGYVRRADLFKDHAGASFL